MMGPKPYMRIAAGVSACALLVACNPSRIISQSVDRFVTTTVDAAARRAGDEVGKAIAGQIIAQLTPAMLPSYSAGVFQLLFAYGGYGATALSPYEPGEYTRWQVEGRSEGDRFERTLLRREDDGREWWRVEAFGDDEGGGSQQVIMEALLSAPDAGGTRHVRRMRAKLPGDRAPQEVPISEDDAHLWVVRADAKLTEESLAGMRVGEEEVKVPAGVFRAEHLKGGQPGGSELHWWVVRQGVPGSVVRFEQRVGDELQFRVSLAAHGKDATASKLGVFDGK